MAKENFDFAANPLCYVEGITDIDVPVPAVKPWRGDLGDGKDRVMYGDGAHPRSHEIVKVVRQSATEFVFEDTLGFTITLRPLNMKSFNEKILPHLMVPPDKPIKTEDELLRFALGS